MLPRPSTGRVFTAGRRVRLGDVDPAGRCRLDAVARYLQDVALDDSADAGLDKAMGWVVRRTMIDVHHAAGFEEWLELATWCSGHGGRWAERRTEIRGDRGASVDTVTLWVHVDPSTGRPLRLFEQFFHIWGESTGGRKVSARTSLDSDPGDAPGEPWLVRATDLDLAGHVNNAAHWAPVEQVLSSAGVPDRFRAELEHGTGVTPGQPAMLHVDRTGAEVRTWLLVGGVAAGVARVAPLGSG